MQEETKMKRKDKSPDKQGEQIFLSLNPITRVRKGKKV
jgi:hypothetical protein